MGFTANVYLSKTLEKPKIGMQILKIRIWELFMHTKGISNLYARHMGRRPLIECAQHDFKIIYFPFFYFLLFGVDKGAVLAPTYPQVG